MKSLLNSLIFCRLSEVRSHFLRLISSLTLIVVKSLSATIAFQLHSYLITRKWPCFEIITAFLVKKNSVFMNKIEMHFNINLLKECVPFLLRQIPSFSIIAGKCFLRSMNSSI